MPIEIPLTTDPSSIFDIVLSERTLRFQTKFNLRGGYDTLPYWTLDITENNKPLINGLVLVLGIDLLKQFNFNLGSLVLINTTSINEDVTSENLGESIALIYYEQNEVAQ